MTDSVVLRQVTLNDIDAMVAMLEPMYRLKRSKEFLIWQCFENINPTVLVGAFDGEAMIGMFGIQKRNLTNGVICGQGSWLNISPVYNGKGYFRKLGELAIKHFPDLDVVCVFGNHRAKTPLEKSLKFQTIGTIDLLVNNDLHRFDTNESECVPIGRETRFDFMDQFENKNVGFVYTQAYRVWRYSLNPMYSYWIVRLQTGEFGIIKKFHEPDSGTVWGDIVDIEYNPKDQVGLLTLMREILSHLYRLGAVKATIWALPEMTLRKVVVGLGFKKSGYKTFVSLKVLKGKHNYLRDFSIWNVRQADATNY